MSAITLFRNYDENQPVVIQPEPGQTFKQAIIEYLDKTTDVANDGLTYGTPEEGRELAKLSYNESGQQEDEMWEVLTVEPGDYGWSQALQYEELVTWEEAKEKFAQYVAYVHVTNLDPRNETRAKHDNFRE